MQVLVTGHDGYLGSVMVPFLLKAGHRVVGLDTFFFETGGFGRGPKEHIVPARRKDVRDVREEDLRGFDAVIHLAALGNDPMSDLNPRWTDEINRVAAVRLARLAKDAGAERFLFASSCSVYGGPSKDEVADEDTSVCPTTYYAASKIRAEDAIAALAGRDFCPVFLRNATVYGISPRMRTDLVVNAMTGWACTTKQICILCEGSPWRPVVGVEDVAGVFAAMLDAPRAAVSGQVFNVGRSDENYQLHNIAEIVRTVVPEVEVLRVSNPSRTDWSYQVDFSKLARALPGFVFAQSMRAGVERLCRAYAAAGLQRGDLEDGRFARLRQLQNLIAAGAVDSTLRWRNIR